VKQLICAALAVLVLEAISHAAPAPVPGAQPAPAATASPVPAPAPWVENRNYFLIKVPRKPDVPAGKVEVTEVFSYACPACNSFLPTMQKLQASLPPNAVLDYVPAAFNTAEDWPMFQQAYCTAQALGIADANHVAVFDAVWGSGELAVVDTATGRLKPRQPTIDDAARFYEKHAHVPAAKFVATAKGFQVDTCVRRDEDLVKAYMVDSTPTLIVNGKYRITAQSAGVGAPPDQTPTRIIELVRYLVARESH